MEKRAPHNKKQKAKRPLHEKKAPEQDNKGSEKVPPIANKFLIFMGGGGGGELHTISKLKLLNAFRIVKQSLTTFTAILLCNFTR